MRTIRVTATTGSIFSCDSCEAVSSVAHQVLTMPGIRHMPMPDCAEAEFALQCDTCGSTDVEEVKAWQNDQ